MSHIIDLLIAFGIGFFLGYKFMRLIISMSLREIAVEQGINLDELQKSVRKDMKIEEIISIVTEKHGDGIYAFDEKSDTFLCQGNTIEDLAKKLREQNNVLVAKIVHNDEELWLIDGKIEKDLV